MSEATLATGDRANPVLVEVTRSGVRESVHRGTVVLVGPDGEMRSLGIVGVPTYPRSSLKPLQAVAMVRAGLTLPPQLLALVGASHDGTPDHVRTARAILATAGLGEEALACPETLPESASSSAAVLAGGGKPARIYHNCSGKHAGMVATCVLNQWPVAGYLDPDHPMQEAVLAAVDDLADERPRSLGVDGCGALVPTISLSGLAVAFRQIVTAPPGSPERQVADAMRSFPELVGGPGRDVTELMAGSPGLLAKDGAEGVWAAALPDGRAMAAKLDDGALRALPAVLSATLRAWGFSGQHVDRWLSDPMLGGGRPVGAIQPSRELVEWLDGAA